MNERLRFILSDIRKIAVEEGVENISLKSISNRLSINSEELMIYIKDEKDLVSKVLEFERNSFIAIFDEYNFDEMNAIDILMIVSHEIASRYYDVTPAVSRSLKQRFADIYQDHFQKRLDFIFEKIKINLQKGIKQNMYRQDLSIELVARLYLSRLIDIHNETIFPPNQFSFAVLFEVMFDNFVRSVATIEGLNYYETKVKNFDWQK